MRSIEGGAEWILNSKNPIKFLYMLGADNGRITKSNLAPDAFVVYQGYLSLIAEITKYPIKSDPDISSWLECGSVGVRRRLVIGIADAYPALSD